ncbi:unnamed protein product [Rhizoctonia solani]|uniref:C2H2-type domain-containing protein n=1 Tax=Rhizoctonia solani TaxID=456999 RepID=A0A8H2WZK2_9AGAM|nr:unnamed protein product [Rhizoctonia solani]
MGMDRHCFYAENHVYYFDDYYNVYSEDGTLISGSLNSRLDDLLTPNFHIDGVPYWFDLDGLLYQNVDGTMNRVHVWHSDPEPFNLGPVFQPMFLPTFQNDMTSFVPEATPELGYGSSPSPPATQILDFNSPLTKNEVLSPSNSQPLRRAFQGSDFPWSPSSSTKSPIVATASQVAKAQKDAETAQPVKRPSKDERRRCPICNKLFRRPSSLEDHLNVHSGHKVHMCPFKGCCTSFATKSKMKRHFTMHRVGPWEQYRRSETPRANTAKSGKATRAPTRTYNSRAHHTLRFRAA